MPRWSGKNINNWQLGLHATAPRAEGGTIFIRGDTGTPSTSETITIVRELRLEAVGGAVRIGDSP